MYNFSNSSLTFHFHEVKVGAGASAAGRSSVQRCSASRTHTGSWSQTSAGSSEAAGSSALLRDRPDDSADGRKRRRPHPQSPPRPSIRGFKPDNFHPPVKTATPPTETQGDPRVPPAPSSPHHTTESLADLFLL